MSEQKYICKHAYDSNRTEYILCDKEPEPADGKLDGVAKASCPYQGFCGLCGCYTLKEEAVNCPKLKPAEKKVKVKK